MIYGLDTETDHNDKEAWIVQWVIHDGKKARKGTSLDTLKSCLKSLGRPGKHYIYCHNLKYDLEFFKYALYELKEETDGSQLRIIMRHNQPITLTLTLGNRKLIFRDSAKKWQGNLASMGKAYGVEKLEAPGDEDFRAGWAEKLDYSDPETWRYVSRDAEIVAIAMQQMHRIGASKSTTSGDAWKSAHEIINGKQWIPGKDKWTQLFPSLPYELDRQLRPAYFGGINISNRKGYIEGPITHEDKVSMYPSVMYYDPLPHGQPIYIGDELPEEGQLYIIKVRLKFRLKDNHIAWLSFKQGIDYAIEGDRLPYGSPVDYTEQWHIMTLCNVDLETLQMDYDVEFDGEFKTECWVFHSEIGIMRPYIDHWIKIKQESPKNSAERAHAKRMLNACYGRYALIQESELINLDWSEEEDDLKFFSSLTVSQNDAYIPYAIFCTAWARRHLMDRVNTICEAYGSDAMIHSDTDSVIYQGEPLGGTGKNLGDWDLESQPIGIYEGGFKRYIEIHDKAKDSLSCFSMACAGVPQHLFHDGVPRGMWIELLDDPERITHAYTLGQEHYRINSAWLRQLFINSGRNPDDVNTLKLIPVKVPGGVILEGRQHELSDGLKVRFNRCL